MVAGTLDIDRISKRYGEIVALREMTFSVRAGELFGFVGSNGAGKTTTMRIALGVLSADAGEVRLNGEPVDIETRRRIGYMPEERGLYPKMKVLDQLVYLAELHGMSARDAHRSAENWIDRLDVREHRTHELQKLSLGNQQRVQLAAALVHEPSVLILDEPFAGLDPVAVEVMGDVLREKAKAGAPVVFSSHQLDLVERLCDRVGIVQSGAMVACGAVDELRDSGSVALAVDVPKAPAGWAAELPGARVVAVDGTRTLLELETGADDQAVLHAALAAGEVREFARQRPSLTQLFHDVVAEERA